MEKEAKETNSEFYDTIISIIDYYSLKSIKTEEEPEEDIWKKKTKYQKSQTIPVDIDKKVKKLFTLKLNNLIKKEKEVNNVKL